MTTSIWQPSLLSSTSLRTDYNANATIATDTTSAAITLTTTA